MNTFRKLITEVKTKMDKEVQFFIDHGIDPSTKYSNIPLYNPETNGLVILRGAVDTSPYFTTGKISPKDQVIIQSITEDYVPRKELNVLSKGNFYTKNYGEKVYISVNDFINTIYNNPRNEETKEYLRINDLDSQDKINQANADYVQARKQQDDKKQHDFETWVNRYGDWFDLEDMNTRDKEATLHQLYKASQQGYAISDLNKLPIIWKAHNKKTFDIINQKIKNLNNKELQDQLKHEFTNKQREWFKAKLDTVDTLKSALDWWKSINTTESVLTELSFPQKQKTIGIKDKDAVKRTLLNLGIDDRFITVPIIKEPIYNKQKYKSAEEDPLADPVQKLTIVSFPDQDKLDDKYGLVRVKDSVSGESFNMNIGELKELINKEENQNTTLDTVDYRLHGGQEFSSLNQGMGKFIDLPEEVILEMLTTVNHENEDFEYVDLVEYYKHEKETGIPNPLLTKALQSYNQGENTSQFVIRKFNTADGIKYKGFVPNVENPNSKSAMAGKDKYKELFK